MPTYLTVMNLMEIFQKSESTIWRWVNEGKEILSLDKRMIYIPEKDPGGHCWRFEVKIIDELRIKKEDIVIEKRIVRRILSRGI
jgi:hypothetical protein